MEEIIHAFGIDWRLISIQIFNFVLLAVALSYFLYTPVLRMLREREAKIKQGVEDAEKAHEARKEADATKAEIITAAHAEGAGIVSKATAYADEKSTQILRETEARILRELTDAKVRAAEIEKEAIKKSEAEIAKLAILAAEKVLRTELTK